MKILDGVKKWARSLRSNALIVYFSARDSRTSIYLKLFAMLIVAYALSPIDLIPDFIPIVGYLDDLVIVPLGLLILLKFLPSEVLSNSLKMANAEIPGSDKYLFVFVVVSTWLLSVGLVVIWWYGKYQS